MISFGVKKANSSNGRRLAGRPRFASDRTNPLDSHMLHTNLLVHSYVFLTLHVPHKYSRRGPIWDVIFLLGNVAAARKLSSAHPSLFRPFHSTISSLMTLKVHVTYCGA